jgi:hypothetical protein
MTDSNELKNKRKREKRAEEIRDKFDTALLSELGSNDPAAVRAALKIVNDRAFERIEALQTENVALKQVAGNTADLDAAVAAKVAAELELEKIKQEWSVTVNAEVKKVHNVVNSERHALSQREVVIKRTESALKASTDATKIKLAFDFLGSLVSRMESWRPKEFFDPEVPNVFWVKRIWWPDRESWVIWHEELLKMPREKQIATMARDAHCRTCINHQREKVDRSQERADFLESRMKFMGAEVQNEIFTLTRQMNDHCRLQPHPMSHSVDFDYGARRNMQTKMITGEGLPSYL